MAPNSPSVALFVTCLVDLFRPTVGFATVKLLQEAGCRVSVPEAQTCCGQPAWNSGDRTTARQIAEQVIVAMEGHDYVVAPSGSCAGTMVKDYPLMFEEGTTWHARAMALAAKTHEITSFLTDVLGIETVAAEVPRLATYHDSCSGLRTLGVKEQPRKLLASAGVQIREMEESEVCCGFGGTFCVKYPDISNTMVGDKTRNASETGAELLLAGDLGCLMNMAGKASRDNRPIEVRHVVEVLAGMTDTPAIGEGSK